MPKTAEYEFVFIFGASSSPFLTEFSIVNKSHFCFDLCLGNIFL